MYFLWPIGFLGASMPVPANRQVTVETPASYNGIMASAYFNYYTYFLDVTIIKSQRMPSTASLLLVIIMIELLVILETVTSIFFQTYDFTSAALFPLFLNSEFVQ